MEINNANQSASSTERSSHMDLNPVNDKRINYIIILGLFLILLAVGGGYYLGATGNNDNQTANNSGDITLTPTQTSAELRVIPLTPTAPLSITPGVAVYKHPSLHYALEYPTSWVVKTVPSAPGAHETFFVQSADYEAPEMLLEQGAQIAVFVENTSQKSVNYMFNKDDEDYDIIPSAKNKTRAIVDGEVAIQYDYNWEGVNATMTEFIKNGKRYTIRYRYIDDNGKQAELSTYINLLKSFRAI